MINEPEVTLPQKQATTRTRVGIVVEQTLGHVTHYRNLQDFSAQQADIEPVWLPVEFAAGGMGRLLPVFRSNWSVRASLRARRAIDRELAHRPLDALLFHTQVTALFAQDLMRRVPSVVSLDATPINYDSVGKYYRHKPAGEGLLDRQKYRLNRESLHAATRLVTWSEWTRSSLVDDYGITAERIRVLAPGAAAAYFDIGRKRVELESETDEHRPVRVLFVGADFHRKGGPILLECMRGPLGRQCELHVVTQAGDIPPLPNVVVHRNLRANTPELRDLFAAADIFVLPTRADCLAVVLMEATAAALPVITTDVGALAEAVRPGASGLLVRPGDSDDLSAALSALVGDPRRRRNMGKSGFALAQQKFDARLNNRALFDILGEIGGGQPQIMRAA